MFVDQQFVGLNAVCHLAVEISYLLLELTIGIYKILDPEGNAVESCVFVSMRSDHLCDPLPRPYFLSLLPPSQN